MNLLASGYVMTKMRVADYVATRLSVLGIDTAFVVTGGGAMHLNDAIGKTSALRKVFCHHEQAAAMAAEAYARVAERPALLNVTTGPGGINSLNGIFGAYTDSIPLIVVSGQVKRETFRRCRADLPPLRQLGDQEVDILEMVRGITKFSRLVANEAEIYELLDEAFIQATEGRPGPVWLDIPVDVQGTFIDVPADRINLPLRSSCQVDPKDTIADDADAVLDLIEQSRRPVLIGGTGIRIGKAIDEFIHFAEQRRIPVTTAWTHDLIPSDHELFAGRPGTIGTRAGNFVVQNADLVIVIGSRLNIRQVSYNWGSFAKSAKKIWIDIDPNEFRKPFVKADVEIVADAKKFLSILSQRLSVRTNARHFAKWIAWCNDIKARYSPKESDYPVSADRINAYHFISELFEHLCDHDIVVCGNATATIVPFQVGKIKTGMRLVSNSGSASMGYDIPAALGVAIASPEGRVICLAGDGSAMMNIQELQTISSMGGNVKILILDNDGYLSIKQTQRNFFGRESGSSSGSGLAFPDFVRVGEAFGLASVRLGRNNWRKSLPEFLSQKGPALACVELDLLQEFEPRLKSKMVDGVITTPELDDMFPFLPAEEISQVRNEAKSI